MGEVRRVGNLTCVPNCVAQAICWDFVREMELFFLVLLDGKLALVAEAAIAVIRDGQHAKNMTDGIEFFFPTHKHPN